MFAAADEKLLLSVIFLFLIHYVDNRTLENGRGALSGSASSNLIRRIVR